MNCVDTVLCHAAGFSEYASYNSFVRSRHPQSQRLAARKTWLRYGLGGEAALRAGRALSLSRLCCPSRNALLAARLLGCPPPSFTVELSAAHPLAHLPLQHTGHEAFGWQAASHSSIT